MVGYIAFIWSLFGSIVQQKDPKTGEVEGLSYSFNLCEAVATWEQVIIFTCLLQLLIFFHKPSLSHWRNSYIKACAIFLLS